MNGVVGMWHSLVARIVRDDEAAGSNPVIPTIEIKRLMLGASAFFVCHRDYLLNARWAISFR